MSKGMYPRKQSDDEKRLTKAKADLAELKAAEAAEKLVDATQIEKDFVTMCLGFRNRMLQIPTSLAVTLSELESATEIEELLKAEISEALESLSLGEDK